MIWILPSVFWSVPVKLIFEITMKNLIVLLSYDFHKEALYSYTKINIFFYEDKDWLGHLFLRE